MKALDKFTIYSGKVCSYISGFFLFVLLFMVASDVFLRKMFNSPINGGYELVSLIMPMLVFFSIIYTQSTHSAVHVMVLLARLRGKGRTILWAFGMLFTTAMGGIFAYGSFVHGGLMRMVSTGTTILRIPFWPFYYVGAFTFALYTIVLAIHTIKSFAALFSDSIAEEVTSHWVE